MSHLSVVKRKHCYKLFYTNIYAKPSSTRKNSWRERLRGNTLLTKIINPTSFGSIDLLMQIKYLKLKATPFHTVYKT